MHPCIRGISASLRVIRNYNGEDELIGLVQPIDDFIAAHCHPNYQLAHSIMMYMHK